MATIVQFPTGKPITQRVPTTPKSKAALAAAPNVVSPIRKRLRVPKRNRPEDDSTILFARLAKIFSDGAYELAQTEPGSKLHREYAHMAGISDKLPRNNLRLFITPEDYLTGVWSLWRKVRLACLEWEVCEAHRTEAIHSKDIAAKIYWESHNKKAEKKAWLEYERLVRVPAASLTDFKSYKLDRRFKNGMGSIDWMRKWKPDLAAILDEELALLTAAKDARKARRARKGEA